MKAPLFIRRDIVYNRADSEYRKKFDFASYGTKPMQSFNSTAEPHILMAILELMEKQNEMLERMSKKFEDMESKETKDKAVKIKETKKK